MGGAQPMTVFMKLSGCLFLFLYESLEKQRDTGQGIDPR
jgi:hypothetical protein